MGILRSALLVLLCFLSLTIPASAVTQILGANVDNTSGAVSAKCANLNLTKKGTLTFNTGHTQVASLGLISSLKQWYVVLRETPAGATRRLDFGSYSTPAVPTTSGTTGTITSVPNIDPGLATLGTNVFLTFTTDGVTAAKIQKYTSSVALLGTGTVNSSPISGGAQNAVAGSGNVYFVNSLTATNVQLSSFAQASLAEMDSVSTNLGTTFGSAEQIDTINDLILGSKSSTNEVQRWRQSTLVLLTSTAAGGHATLTGLEINANGNLAYVTSTLAGLNAFLSANTYQSAFNGTASALQTYSNETSFTDAVVYDSTNNKVYLITSDGTNAIIRRLNSTTLVTEQALTITPNIASVNRSAVLDITNQIILYTSSDGGTNGNQLVVVSTCGT